MFNGPHPETGEDLTVVDQRPEAVPPNDLPSQPAVFAPDYAPEEIAEIARKLRDDAGLPKEPTGVVANGEGNGRASRCREQGHLRPVAAGSATPQHRTRHRRPRHRADLGTTPCAQGAWSRTRRVRPQRSRSTTSGEWSLSPARRQSWAYALATGRSPDTSTWSSRQPPRSPANLQLASRSA